MKILTDVTMMAVLNDIKKNTCHTSERYSVDIKKETSCARCSGSAGRYIYEKKKRGRKRFSPSVCITHRCNLKCIYCYQKHDSSQNMTFDTAKKVVDWCFDHAPEDTDGIEFTFIGGEPLLEFNLIKDIFDYSFNKDSSKDVIFYATTNGTLLNDEMKDWFFQHRNSFYLRLSLDGTADTHNHNRSNSFDLIDIDFFRKTWPEMGAKMTLSDYSLNHLARDIEYLHSLGFDDIGGVNLCEGEFNWDKDEYISALIPQLEELVDYYADNPSLRLDQLFDKRIDLCEASVRPKVKRCGIGCETVFFDIDGTMYPCTYTTPMTFSRGQLEEIKKTNFTNPECFIDEDCFTGCYLYPICPTCSGANYLVNKSFNIRNKTKCKILKLVSLYIAELLARKIISSSSSLKDNQLFFTIEAIEHIKEKYLEEFLLFIEQAM